MLQARSRLRYFRGKPLGTTGAILHIKPRAVPTVAPGRTTGAITLIPLRMVSGRFTATGVVSSANQRNLRPWYPGRHVPFGKDAAGKPIYISPDWDRFFSFFADTMMGGINASTVPEVEASITYGQAQALIDQAILVAQTQWLQNLAQAIDATKQVVVSSSLPGSDQIPPVQLTGEGGITP